MIGEATMIERIPVEIDLHRPDMSPLTGIATAAKDLDTGEVTLEVVFFADVGLTLEKFTSAFEIKTLNLNSNRGGE